MIRSRASLAMITVLFAVVLLTVSQKNIIYADLGLVESPITSVQVVGSTLITEQSGSVYADGRRIASGTDPDCKVTKAHMILCLFTNTFQGASNIASIQQRPDGSWELPRYVTYPGEGNKRHGRLAITAAGIYATWEHTYGDRSYIYLGQLYRDFWSSYPLTNGAGSEPAMAAGDDDSLLIAWSDIVHRIDSENREILVVHIPYETLPLILSDSPEIRAAATQQLDFYRVSAPTDSAGSAFSSPTNLNTHPPATHPSVAYNRHLGRFQVVWYEGNEQSSRLRHASGYRYEWTWPETVADGIAEDTPQIAERLFGASLAWRTGEGELRISHVRGRSTAWEDPSTIGRATTFRMNEYGLAWVMPDGSIQTIVWPVPRVYLSLITR